MKIITWNCQGAFRKKIDYILELEPDILLIQECENIEKIMLKEKVPKIKEIAWHSDDNKKGLGIFSKPYFNFELLSNHESEFRYIIPYKVTGKELTFNLFAIWAMINSKDRSASYIGQIWHAINSYNSLLNENSTILIGDFNSNKIWDNKVRIGNHTDVVNKLTEKRIFSVYHNHFNMEHGKEIHPTFYMYRKKEIPYHIDYCFASEDLLKKVKDVEIGDYEKWSTLSDHCPLCITFDM